MSAYSIVNFASLFAGLDLSAEHYHPNKLKCLAQLSGAGRTVASYVRSVRQLVNPYPADQTPIFDLGAANNHVLQSANAQAQDRVSTKKACRAGDVIISRLRSYLRQVAVVPPGLDKAYLSTEFIVLRPQDGSPAEFLLPFFLTECVQTVLEWSQDGNEHPRFNESVLLQLTVPPAVDSMRKKLTESVTEIVGCFTRASAAFSEAESLLVSALDLDKLDLTPRLFYEQSYKDVDDAGRLDAEYFQPPKWRVLESLAKMPGRTVGEHYRTIKSLWQPVKAGAGARVRNYDLTDALSPFLDDTIEPTIADEIGSTKKRLQAGDLVVSRLRSYLKEMALFHFCGSQSSDSWRSFRNR